MAFIGMRVNREGGFARLLRMLGRNAISQDLALKPPQRRCKLSGSKCPVLGVETPQNAIQAACLPPAPRFSR